MGVAAILLTTASATLAYAIHRHENSGLSPALKSGLVWGLGLTLPLTLVTAGTLSAMPGHWVGGTPHEAGGLAMMGWPRDGADLRVAHFFATHALHVIPLFALIAGHLPGLRGEWAVSGFAGLYVTLVILTFAQALAGQPFF